MKHRIAAVSVVLFGLAACGGGGVSDADARRIVVSGLIDAGQPPDVAECVADTALERHSPGELVNSSGTTSAEVNASVAGIVAECAANLSPAASPTSPPPTTADTAPGGPLDPAACNASYAVLVVLAAADLMNDPGPAAFERWVGEAADRTELAVLTAPDGELRELHMGLRAAIDELRTLAEANAYDSSAPDPDGRADAIGAELDTLGADLADAVEAGECPIDLSDRTEAEALAAELAALDVPATTTPSTAPTTTPTTVPTTVPVTDVLVEHAASGIRVSVPAEWSGEAGGVADTKYGPATRFVVRAPDPAVFDEGRFDGSGTAIYARDATVDFNAMLAVSGPVQACTFASEQPYDDGVYVGIRRDYTNCAGTPVAIVVIGAADDDAQIATYVEIRVPSLDDRAVNVVLNSFYV